MPTAFDYLAHPEKSPIAPVCVLYGDEGFLIQQCTELLGQQILQGQDAEFSKIVLDGSKQGSTIIEWRAVADELHTVSLFGSGLRMVLVSTADDFISANREHLEHYVAKPGSAGILILQVKSFPSNTRLYKAVASAGLLIDCKTPDEALLIRWLTKRAESAHRSKLPADASEQLLEIVGPELGRLDQELEKLSLIALGEQVTTAGANAQQLPTITRDLVIDVVGGWRAKTAWELGDRMCNGEAVVALEQLSRLIEAGDEPIALLAQVAASLRRYGAMTRLADLATVEKKRVEIKSLLQEVSGKVWPDAVMKAEAHLKQLTRVRGRQLLHWLIEADLQLKGTHSSGHKSRLVLEQLIVKMSKQALTVKA
jgi:DNA polymerase III subunit delta